MHHFNFLLKNGLLLITMLVLTVLPGTAFSQGCSQPSNLNSNVVSSGVVALSWSAIGGAVNYTVQYRVGNSGTWTNGGTVTTTNQVLFNLAPETVYTWRVKASCSTYSSVATFNSGGGVGGNTACSSPSNLNAAPFGPGSATLSWSAIEGALYYTVQYRAGSTGPWTTAGSVTSTTLTLNGLLLNTEYTWRVKASCSVYSSVSSFNTGINGGGGNTSCSQPSNLDALLLSPTIVELSWSAIQEAFDYTVQYRQGLSGPWLTAGTTEFTSLILSGLSQNSTYSWRVKASCSEYSSVAVFSTGAPSGGGGGSSSCSAPSNTNTDWVLPTSAGISWEAQGGALDYTVQYRLENGVAYTTVGTFTSPSATIQGLMPGQQYVWRVKANCSPYGSDVQFSTPAASPAGGGVASLAAEREGPSTLQIFPNPATSDAVYITNETDGAQLQMVSLSGQIVLSEILNQGRQLLPVAHLKNGFYLLHLTGPEGRLQTGKLIIAH